MSARIAVYPGSFDPVTLGHMDLITRASNMFEKLVVAVLRNDSKTPCFDAAVRQAMIEEAVAERGLTNVEVVNFNGLLVEFAESVSATVVIRGLRAISDMEYELQLALMNRRLSPGLETVFLTAGEDVSFISSRLVRQIAEYQGDVSSLVPRGVLQRLQQKYGGTSTAKG